MNYPGFEHALSVDRFGRYLGWSGGNRDKAIALYTLNTRLSEALYPALQTLEVTLRNRIHDVMSEEFGDRWFDVERMLLIANQNRQFENAIRDLGGKGGELSPGSIVAALTFSFWTAITS